MQQKERQPEPGGRQPTQAEGLVGARAAGRSIDQWQRGEHDEQRQKRKDETQDRAAPRRSGGLQICSRHLGLEQPLAGWRSQLKRVRPRRRAGLSVPRTHGDIGDRRLKAEGVGRKVRDATSRRENPFHGDRAKAATRQLVPVGRIDNRLDVDKPQSERARSDEERPLVENSLGWNLRRSPGPRPSGGGGSVDGHGDVRCVVRVRCGTRDFKEPGKEVGVSTDPRDNLRTRDERGGGRLQRRRHFLKALLNGAFYPRERRIVS